MLLARITNALKELKRKRALEDKNKCVSQSVLDGSKDVLMLLR